MLNYNAGHATSTPTKIPLTHIDTISYGQVEIRNCLLIDSVHSYKNNTEIRGYELYIRFEYFQQMFELRVMVPDASAIPGDTFEIYRSWAADLVIERLDLIAFVHTLGQNNLRNAVKKLFNLDYE